MKTLLSLLWQGVRRYPSQWAGLFGLLTILAGLWVIEPLFSSYAVDELLTIADGKDVNELRLFGIWGGIFLALSLVQAAAKYIEWKMNMRLELDFVQDTYRHTLHLPAAFHVQQKTGESMRIIDEAGGELAFLMRTCLDLLPSTLSSLGFLVISIMIEPILAMVLVVTIALYTAVVVFGSIRTQKLQFKANKQWVKPSGRAFDVMSNILAVKSGAREESEVGTMRELHRSVEGYQLRVNRWWAGLEALNFFMLARIVLIALGILLLVQGVITLGEVYYFQLSFFRVLVPCEILAGVLPLWAKSMGKIQMAMKLRELETEDAADRTSQTLPTLQGSIRFEEVSFSYRTAEFPFLQIEEEEETHGLPSSDTVTTQNEDGQIVPRAALEHPEAHTSKPADEEPVTIDALQKISLSIEAGEHIALVGHSGAGKSTFAMLINRFYDPSSGTIFVDDQDLSTLDRKWWRSQIGLVQQENVLFHSSILDNIRYARPDATMEDVEKAAERASAKDFIDRLPQGYKTIVGERGVKLSGGERQRLAIARAILKNPRIVVLDEATSALDSMTERQVQAGIQELIEHRTAIIIAHRLSTVRSVDRIAVMEKGQVIAFAPHEELMKTSDIYRQMVEMQQAGILSEDGLPAVAPTG